MYIYAGVYSFLSAARFVRVLSLANIYASKFWMYIDECLAFSRLCNISHNLIVCDLLRFIEGGTQKKYLCKRAKAIIIIIITTHPRVPRERKYMNWARGNFEIFTDTNKMIKFYTANGAFMNSFNVQSECYSFIKHE